MRMTSLEQMKQFAAERNLPLEKMRFFFGEERKDPKCFYIYQDPATSEWVVCKNKSDGSRAERYRGNDEVKACQIIWSKLEEEAGARGYLKKKPVPEKPEENSSGAAGGPAEGKPLGFGGNSAGEYMDGSDGSTAGQYMDGSGGENPGQYMDGSGRENAGESGSSGVSSGEYSNASVSGASEYSGGKKKRKRKRSPWYIRRIRRFGVGRILRYAFRILIVGVILWFIFSPEDEEESTAHRSGYYQEDGSVYYRQDDLWYEFVDGLWISVEEPYWDTDSDWVYYYYGDDYSFDDEEDYFENSQYYDDDDWSDNSGYSSYSSYSSSESTSFWDWWASDDDYDDDDWDWDSGDDDWGGWDSGDSDWDSDW